MVFMTLGYTDWASQKLAESHLSIDVSQRNRLRAAKQVTEFVLQNSKIGRVFGPRTLKSIKPVDEPVVLVVLVASE